MALGFIILRHVNNKETNQYWQICYNRVRKYYPESDIVIIDDNSDYNFIDTAFQNSLYKTTIIRSLWAGRGELLPYFYYVSYGWFNTAVILHDSVFINKYIDFTANNTLGYRFLWEFDIKQDNDYMQHHNDEVKLMKRFNTSETDKMLEFHRSKHAWAGCFGAMSVVTLDYLKKVNLLFPLSNLIDGIVGRFNRMSFERIIACIFQYTSTLRGTSGFPHLNEENYSKDKEAPPLMDENSLSLFGNIFEYCKYGIGITRAMKQTNLPIIKVWTGR